MVQTLCSHAVAHVSDARAEMSPPAKTPRRRARDSRSVGGSASGGSAAIELTFDGHDVAQEEESTPDVDGPVPDPPFVGDEAPGIESSDEDTRAELEERLGAYLSKGRPRVVVTDNVYTMVSIKRGDGVVTFRLHHMFLDAPPAVLRALGRYADKQDREAAKVLRVYIDTNDHRIRARRSPRPITVDVQGKHYNLQEIFDDLNARYFDGEIRARITWGPRSRRKKSRDSIKPRQLHVRGRAHPHPPGARRE